MYKQIFLFSNMNFLKRRVLSLILAFLMVFSANPINVFAENTTELPTATVTEIEQEPLTFALNFKADEVTEGQLEYYGDWYADFVLTVNKDITFNANGDADGYLSGQYDEWSKNWVNVPFEDVKLAANTPLKIMEYASKLMNQSGLKYTYREVYEYVNDFDCGVYFDETFIENNPDLEGTLELRMYNPANEAESYAIGEPYEFSFSVAKNVNTGAVYMKVADALSAAAAEETVVLLRDVKTSVVAVPENITLDLGAYTLEADYVACFGNIVDLSDNNAGLLNVDPNYFLIQTDNTQLPVKCSEGYKFYENTGYNKRYLEATRKFAFQPLLETASLEAIGQGAAASGATVNVRVSWTQADGRRTQDFVYSDDFVSKYLNSYNTSSGKFGQMFTLTLNGTENFENLTFSAVVASDTGVELESEATTVKKEETGNVTTDDSGLVTEEVTIQNDQASAVVGEGTQLNENTTSLTLTTQEMSTTGTNITLGEGEQMRSLDVHVEGVSANNTKPIIITLEEIAPEYLNQGNISLYHVENGETVEMTRVYTLEEVDAHNEFYYDILTGTITMALATFSEVAVVADTENKWNGDFDYSWYTETINANADAKEFMIANADQLAAFGAIVGGMNGQTQDSFAGKTVKLLADINLGDEEEHNNPDLIFYPIGYYNSTKSYEKVSGGSVTSSVSSFEGTFDGNGHTIANFYQNTWEMFGDYNDGYPAGSNHYKDAMGLFGYVVNGTVKNLTIDHFSSDGEFTPTGVIAAYAVNSTFENIAITNCNPRVYNTGNGGIVGIGGNSTDTTESKLNFTNITIDKTNKISALWGSWDVACGGLMGMFRGYSEVKFTNCHVGAQIDVYNDVCGNYQYYWYRYAGMMIGSLRGRNTTDEAGYTVPNMTGITASGCTVHFGEWNDYYYCELVANSLASYTHDHQFSRLEQIDSLDAIKENENWTKTGNFLIIKDDGTKTCCHIMKDVDGNLYEHKHDVADSTNPEINEIVDGETVLKENNQIVYLPFNQLFQGDGWGVKHVPIYDDGKSYYEGITILDREVANSVVKFDKANTAKDSYTTGTTVPIGELFKAATIEDNKLSIKPENVQVTVSPVSTETEISTAGATYNPNTADWTQGTLTFSGLGVAEIIITDYYYCTATKLSITVMEPVSVKKFEVAFDHDPDTDGNQNYVDTYLYRVGNANTVALGSLFEAIDGAKIGNVTVTVEALNGADVSGTYTANTTDWTKGTILFAGTGPVKVTIDDVVYAEEKTLYLEVVNATNVTNYSGLGNKNSVLLNDITMSNGGSYYLSGATLYGNGFTFDMTDGTYTAGNAISSNYVFGLNSANLDNVKVIGAVYTKYGATVKSEYNRAAVLTSGNSTITNCYISNCASAVRVKDGSLEIINSTIKGGNFSNIDIRGGHVVLDNVTTINQVNGNDTAEDGTVVVGLGVVVYYENVLNTTTVEIKNGITQYNYLSKSHADQYITETNANQLVTEMFKDEYRALQCTTNSDKWVNTGIISMTSNVGNENVTDVSGYSDANPIFAGKTGYVHTRRPDVESVSVSAPSYETEGQGAIAPSYSFDYKTKNYVAKTDGSNDYCYEENGTVYVSMDEGDSFSWDTSILTATKNGQTLDYSVIMADTDYTGKSIMFNKSGSYDVVYSYTDDNNYHIDENGNITAYSKIYAKTVHISVAVIKPTTKHAEFTFGSSNQATEKITVGNNTYISAIGVSHDNSKWSYITVNGQKIYYPIVEATIVNKKTAYFNVFKNVVAITDYADGGIGTAITYNSSTTAMPSGLSVVKGKFDDFVNINSDWSTLNDSVLILSGASNVFKYAASASASSTPTTYSGALCFKSPDVTPARNEYYTMVQYSYTDSTNTTYYYYVGYHMAAKGKGSDICVTPDTLVTMADGTKKEIQHVSIGEDILAWNFYTGSYETVPASLVQNHGTDDMNILHLYFDDGTELKVLGEHGILDADLNTFIFIDEYDVENYLGHNFIKQDGNGYTTVKLVDYEVTDEYTSAYTILSTEHYNVILEGMFTVTPAHVGDNFFNPFEIGEGLKYDEESVKVDIEKYGLYTYEDFDHVLTYEQFVALNMGHFKVSVGKGLVTYEGLIYLIENFINR